MAATTADTGGQSWGAFFQGLTMQVVAAKLTPSTPATVSVQNGQPLVAGQPQPATQAPAASPNVFGMNKTALEITGIILAVLAVAYFAR